MEIDQYIVIDGQQRITTITLLLIALRDFDNFKSNNLVRKIDDYLTNRKEIGKKKMKRNINYFYQRVIKIFSLI